LPRDLPDVIKVDVSALDIGDSIHVREITLPQGVTTRVGPDLTAFSVLAPTVEEEPVAAVAEAAAGPEVIREKKEEPEGAAPKEKAAAPKEKEKEQKKWFGNHFEILEQETSQVRLVIGLGNPGAEYNRTRHNVGFEVVDLLASEWGLAWQHDKSWHAQWAKGEKAILVKPTSYMNRSGEPLAAVANFYKISPAEILVVLDDLALELGRLRLRPDGGTGGHNGLESIIVQFGTEAIARLRIGIGAAPQEGAVDYVLGRFFEEERPMVEKMIVRAADAVKCVIDKGLLSAMNLFNKIPESWRTVTKHCSSSIPRAGMIH